MAEYLYSMIRTNAGSQQQQQQQQQQQRGMPTQVQMQSLDYPLFVDSSGETLLPSEAAARLLWKKSAGAGAGGEANKQIHFHPCYFNAVSCF